MLLAAEIKTDGDEWDGSTTFKRRLSLPSHLILLALSFWLRVLLVD